MTTARDIVTGGAECIGENETLEDAARKIRDLDVGSLPICGEDNRLKGMLTDHVTPESDGVVRVEVRDRSYVVPRVRRATGAVGSGGYGLRVVGQLSESCGWEQIRAGKAVWSHLACGH
jgi:hypothetical protein